MTGYYYLVTLITYQYCYVVPATLILTGVSPDTEHTTRHDWSRQAHHHGQLKCLQPAVHSQPVKTEKKKKLTVLKLTDWSWWCDSSNFFFKFSNSFHIADIWSWACRVEMEQKHQMTFRNQLEQCPMETISSIVNNSPTTFEVYNCDLPWLRQNTSRGENQGME